jgi:3-methyladenine DNA glycosylase AlkD
LKSLGNEKMRAQNKKHGAGDNQFGVQHGDIRKLAAKIKTNHELALALWETGNIDAQYLAILLMKPEELTAREMDRMVRSVTFAWVADWLNSYVVKNHPDKEALRRKWLAAENPWAARAGWSLTSERISKTSAAPAVETEAMKPIDFHDEAEDEARAAALHYASSRPELGNKIGRDGIGRHLPLLRAR